MFHIVVFPNAPFPLNNNHFQPFIENGTEHFSEPPRVILTGGLVVSTITPPFLFDREIIEE